MTVAPRLNKLRDTLRSQELDAMLVSSPENRRYLSGFTGSAGYLLVSQSDALLGTDFRYIEQAGRQAPDYRIERLPPAMTWLPEMASQIGVSRIGFESRDLSVHTHAAFQKAIEESSLNNRPVLVETSDTLDRLRAGKYTEEMELLGRAIEITDQAIQEVSSTIAAGMTEEQVAWDLEKAMRQRGAEGMAFDIIVAAGPNAALPHHLADDTVIREGVPVVIDMGARYQGYCADLTRTIVVGKPDEKFRRVYGIVLQAQLAAEERVRSGMTGEEVDAIARDIIADAGHGDNFGHSLGHGVGLAVHELPGVGPRAKDVIEDGMVFTVEPGVYLSEWGGVRIEDIVVMENGRARVLSKAPKLEFAV